MYWKLIVASFFVLLFAAVPLASVEAALIEQVNDAFRAVYGRDPSFSEWEYWAQRVQRGDKTTYEALVGAISYQKEHNLSPTSVASVPTVAAADTFRVDRSFYPSARNPNFLPDGTLVKSPSSPDVFYLTSGNKSWVLPSLLDRWLGENHYFKHDIIITLSDADLKRYPQTASINPLYVGKVLQHPNGTQYYIDDKLRTRELSAPVRAALKFPGGNLYPTSAVHLAEFKSGPPLTGNLQPGGMVLYDGPFHGGRIWKIEEIQGGALVKRLFLSDYLYESSGYPDESQRVAADAATLARYQRGFNIERYPDGWLVGLNNKTYVVQGGALRHITSPTLFAALGYQQKYVLTVYPEFLRRYPLGTIIGAFKTLVDDGAVAQAASSSASPSGFSTTLFRVRPEIRQLIADINDIYLNVFDKEITIEENRFWVDYIYNGEVNNRTDLIDTMERAKQTGVKPARTSHTAILNPEILKTHWLPYLYYFNHQQEPSTEARQSWYERIDSGELNTIEKLWGTI